MSHQIKINLPNENSSSQALQPIIISWTNPSTDNQSQMIDETRIKQEDELQIISQVIQEVPHPVTRKSAKIISPTRVLRSHGKAETSPVIERKKVSRGGSKTQDVEVITKVVDLTSKSLDSSSVKADDSPLVHKKSASQAKSKKNSSKSLKINFSDEDLQGIIPKITAKSSNVKHITKTAKKKQPKKDKNGNSLKITIDPELSSLISKFKDNIQSYSKLTDKPDEDYIKKEEELDIMPEDATESVKKVKNTDQNDTSTSISIPAIKDEATEEITIKVIDIEPKSEVKQENPSKSSSCISETTSSPLKYFNVSNSSKVKDLDAQYSNKLEHLSKFLSGDVTDSFNQNSINSEAVKDQEMKTTDQDSSDSDDDEDRLVIKEEEDIETIDISDSEDEKAEKVTQKKSQDSWINLNTFSADSNSLTSSNHVSISYPSIDGSTSLQPPVIQISYQFPMDSQLSASSTQIQKHFKSSMEPVKNQQSNFGQLFTKNDGQLNLDPKKQNLAQKPANLSIQHSTSHLGVSISSNKPQTTKKRRHSSLATQNPQSAIENPSKKSKTTTDPHDIPIIPYIPPTHPPRRISSTSSDGSSSTSHPFQCKMCMAIFKRRIDMIHHLKSHSEAKFECQRCGMKFKFEGYFLKHECIACELCNKTFFLKQQLRNHQRNEHDIQQEMYECDLCGKKLRYRHGVLYHMSKTHMKYLEDKYNCDVCGKKFKLKESIRLHIKNHESVIECKLCDKKVKRINLNVHMKSVHVTERKFKCRICRTSFKTKECLKSHIRTHEKSFECTECGKRFSNKSHLKEHLEWHRNPDAYKCHICQKSFAQKYCLKAHSKLHESGHLFTKFKCSLCPYSTDKAENLEKHELKHKRQEENTEMRKNWLQCEKCPVKLKNKLKLATHYWKKHSEVMPK